MAALAQPVAVAKALNSTDVTATLSVPATGGNLLIAVMSNNRSESSAVIPTGFTESFRRGITGTANLTIARKVAVGGEQAITYGTGASTSRLLLSVYELTGIDEAASLPITPVASDQTVASNTHTSGTVSGGDVYIFAASLGTSVTIGALAASALSNGFQTVIAHDAEAGSNNVGQATGFIDSASALSTSFTWTGAAVTSVGAIFALQSSGGTTPPALADKLRVGAVTPTAIYVGATPVTAVYNGPTLVWP